MDETNRPQIAPGAVRYIKLGVGGAWLERCVKEGVIELDHNEVPHALASTLDRAAIEALLVTDGRTSSKAKDFAREIIDFYALGTDALWITIGAGRLWWAFADPHVKPAPPVPGGGARFRNVIDKWHDTDLAGGPLTLQRLSSRLTKVSGYRQTLCRVTAEDYLVRTINAIEDPLAIEGRAVKARLVEIARRLIEQLDWRDFEVLVDLIFASGGWRRSSKVGGSDQPDTDIVVDQPVSGERAFVQIKAKASRAVLSDYVSRYRASTGFDRMFFVTHTAPINLTWPDPDVHVWLGDRLAEHAVKAGLFDWLLEKAR